MAGRIVGAYVDEDLFGVGKHGFRSGDSLVDPPVMPTRITKEWLNGIQEEVIRTLELFGVTPDTSDLDQLGTLLFGLLTASSNLATPPARTTIYPAIAGYPTGADAVSGVQVNFSTGEVFFTSSDAYLVLDLGSRLPDGAVVTEVKALVNPGAARATSADRMDLIVSRRTTGMSFGGPPSVGSSSFVAYPDDGTTNLQVIPSGPISHTVNKSGGTTILATLSPGNTASASNDYFYGWQVSWTDPGPRNF